MRKPKYEFLECAKQMPELRHSFPGEPFDIMKSEVADWLCKQPEIRQRIFDLASYHKLITFDPEKKKWKGVQK